jgi:adenylate cyclase
VAFFIKSFSDMNIEIERKYIVNNNSYKKLVERSVEIYQGYLSRDPERTVRIRTFNQSGYVTIKGKTDQMSRLEFEYEIPYEDAIKLLDLCDGRVLHKVRHIVMFDGHKWEIDEFKGDLSPLIIAEIELSDTDEVFTLPPFVGKEVTGDSHYYNSNL